VSFPSPDHTFRSARWTSADRVLSLRPGWCPILSCGLPLLRSDSRPSGERVLFPFCRLSPRRLLLLCLLLESVSRSSRGAGGFLLGLFARSSRGESDFRLAGDLERSLLFRPLSLSFLPPLVSVALLLLSSLFLSRFLVFPSFSSLSRTGSAVGVFAWGVIWAGLRSGPCPAWLRSWAPCPGHPPCGCAGMGWNPYGAPWRKRACMGSWVPIGPHGRPPCCGHVCCWFQPKGGALPCHACAGG